MEMTLLIVGVVAGAMGAFVLSSIGGRHRIEQAVAGEQRERFVMTERLASAMRDVARLEEALAAERGKNDSFHEEIIALRTRESALETTIEKDRSHTEEKVALLQETATRVKESFAVLSAEALQQSNQSFLALARENLQKLQAEQRGELEQRKQAIDALVKPVREALDKVHATTQAIEKERKEAYGGLTEQIRAMARSQEKLQAETANLVTALRAPQVRGRWGEIQLRNVVEMAGMSMHCDFEEQVSVSTEDGLLRPDMVVRLPGRKQIVVDAKAPLVGYLDAMAATDESAQKTAFASHARHIRDHIDKLASKQYWSQFDTTPELVVLFIPGESFFSAALMSDPSLIEEGIRKGVVVATPTTLIALLKAVAYGWKQETLAESARVISEMGQEIHDRLATMAEHLKKVGTSLGASVDNYNKAVGSLERSVLPSARRFKALGISAKKDVPELSPLDHAVRQMETIPLTPQDADAEEA